MQRFFRTDRQSRLQRPRRVRKGVSYHWGEHHLLIDLGARIEPRLRVLFWVELLITCGIATVFLVEALPSLAARAGDHLWVRWASCIGAAALYGLAAVRFLQRISFRERLVVDDTHLTLVQKDFFSHRSRSYDRRQMSALHYVGKDGKTDHPLAGRHFDYWGFETHERLVQALHGEGSLFFTYRGGFPVRFGRGLYSWDAEEVVRMMRLYCGKSLQLGPEWERMLEETPGS